MCLPDFSQAVVGLPVASCLVTRAPIGEGGKQVIRPYTPISKPNEVGSFDLLIKSYDNGVMSKHFSTLKPGDALEFKGPIIKLSWKPNLKKSLGLVAGGTGITPMLQLIDAVLSNSGEDKTHITLLYGNNTEDDILLRSKLEQLAAAHPKQCVARSIARPANYSLFEKFPLFFILFPFFRRFKVVFVVAKPSSGWTGRTGHATPAMLKELMPPPAADSLIVVCGPPGLSALLGFHRETVLFAPYFTD